MACKKATVELPEANRALLEKLREWNGMTQKELLSHIIKWLRCQDRVVQQITLGQISPEITWTWLCFGYIAEPSRTRNTPPLLHLPVPQSRESLRDL